MGLSRLNPIGIGAKPVSDARFRNDIAQKSGIAQQFSAQITHCDAQQMYRVLVLGVPPEFANQLVMGSDEPCVMH
jgi:hypothetical protein